MRYQEITESQGRPLYHVTFKSRLKAIKQQGLVPGKRRNWKNFMGSSLGSQAMVHLFGDLEGAVRWAHKMAYDFDKPVAILACEVSGELVKDPNATAQMSGQAMITPEAIPAASITGVVYPDSVLYRQIVNGGTITAPPTWQPF